MPYDFKEFKDNLNKAVSHASREIANLRTGKASPQLLDPVVVEVYGAQMKIGEVANVSAPDPNLIVVAPWDKNIIEAIEKSIASAGINLSPVVDGDIIRIVVPPLTEERRKEMVKLLQQKTEATKATFRTIRNDAKKEIEDMEGNSGISEDDIRLDLEELEEIYKQNLDQLEQLVQAKEKELLTV